MSPIMPPMSPRAFPPFPNYSKSFLYGKCSTSYLSLGRLRPSSRSSPGAAESSPEQPGEFWNSSGRALGDPGHLENDSFGSEPWAPNFASNLVP